MLFLQKIISRLPFGSARKKRKAKDAFLFVKGESSEKLLVIFSAANARNFSLYKNMEEYKQYDKLFIRDPYLKSWYQNGVGEYAPDPDMLVKRILAHKRSKNTKVYTAGISMGGYAALLFACLGNFEKALAIVPQTRLRNGFFRNPSKGVDIKYPDLSGLLAQNMATQFHIFAGFEDYIDMCNVSLLPEQKNIHTYIFPKFDHSLPMVLNKRIGINKLIMKMVAGESLACGLEEQHLNHADTRLPYLQQAMERYLAKDYSGAESIIGEALARFPDWIAGHTFQGRVYFDTKRFNEAEACWIKALDIYPLLTEPNNQLGKLYQDRGELEKAKKYYDQFLKVRPSRKTTIEAALKELEGMI